MQQLINAMASGAVYALIALGYTLVFGVLRLINFAHCDVMMVGAYVGYVCCVYLKLPIVLCILIAMAVCGVLGMLIEKTAYKPLREAPAISVLIGAIGVSLILEYSMMLIFKAEPKAYPADFMGGVLEIGEIVLPISKLTTLILSVLMMILLQLFLSYCKNGRAMRAISDDKKAAELCGVNPDKIISFTFFVGSALAGAAGVIYGAMYSVNPLMGLNPGLKAFAAAALGGIGNIPGAVLGGFALGLTETFAAVYFSTALKELISFILLIGILLLKPDGILGKNHQADRL